MNKNPTRRYLRIPRHDGVTIRFPVSEYVLKLENGAKQNTRRVVHTFSKQSASFALMLVLCASSIGITYGNPVSTLSYFRDDETSRMNLFAAGMLGFRLNPGDVTVPISVGDHVYLAPLFSPDSNSFPIQYRVHAETLEDSPLCTFLEAAGTSSPYFYTGALKDLHTETATSTGHGLLEVTLPSAANIANGTSCTIALVYEGWYEGAQENTGYTDREQDTFTFVLNAPEPPAPAATVVVPAEENTEDTPPPSVTDEPATPPSEDTSPEEPTPPEEVPAPPTDTETTTDTPPSPPAETPPPVEENSSEPPPETPPQEAPPSEPPVETPAPDTTNVTE